MNGQYIVAQVIQAAVLGIKAAEREDRSPAEYLEILSKLAVELESGAEPEGLTQLERQLLIALKGAAGSAGMRFYVVMGEDGETAGCELTVKAAKALAESLYEPGDYDIQGVEMPVNAESIRLLLAENGGYAHRLWTVVKSK